MMVRLNGCVRRMQHTVSVHEGWLGVVILIDSERTSRWCMAVSGLASTRLGTSSFFPRVRKIGHGKWDDQKTEKHLTFNMRT
jgi:hypothetical protein